MYGKQVDPPAFGVRSHLNWKVIPGSRFMIPKTDTYYWNKSEEGRRATSLTIGMLLKSYHGFGSLIPSINE